MDRQATVNGGALARGFIEAEREPLLFKGDDFVHTDLEPALRRE